MGIWTKAIKQRTQIAQTVLNKCLKSLETKHLIRAFTNVKFPQRKYYILSHLDPVEEVTGGTFHDPDNGELDTTLIEILSSQILAFVQSKSWDKHSITVPVVSSGDYGEDLPHKQSSLSNVRKQTTKQDAQPHQQRKTIFTPKEPTYEEYPTLEDIGVAIQDSGILKDSVQLSKSDIQLLVDSLLFDNRLERMSAESYRVVRTALIHKDNRIYAGQWQGNGFTEAPCSRCPVFNLCEEGGPVSASNCEYYARWLRPWKYEKDMEDIGREFVLKKTMKEEA